MTGEVRSTNTVDCAVVYSS